MAIVNRRMKVMHIISGDLWAGAEVQAYTLLKQLQSECVLQVILMNPGELADRLMALDIPVVILDESRCGAGSILLAMRKVMLSFEPDIIHTHRQKENILGTIANLLSVRAVSVRTSHGAPESAVKGMGKLQVYLDRLTGRYMQAAIIAVSADLAKKLAKAFPSQKIHVIRNGVDVDVLRESAGLADFRLAAPEAIHIGIIGRLEPVKRVDIFLAMAVLLREQVVDKKILFHVIGDGKLKDNLIAQARTLGMEGAIIFHGHRQDMAACIHSLDAIVMCSDHEGTPMTALEAMALGTPLIAHNVGGLTEILESYPELRVDDHVPQGYASRLLNEIVSGKHNGVDLPINFRADKNSEATKALYQSLCP